MVIRNYLENQLLGTIAFKTYLYRVLKMGLIGHSCFNSLLTYLMVLIVMSAGVMEVVIAAGPFTQSDSVQYEPLQDLMTYASTHRPHVLILIGPLVDLRQSQLIDGSIAESYDAFTDKIISGLMDKLKG